SALLKVATIRSPAAPTVGLFRFSAIDQLADCRSHKPEVAGSSPARASNSSPAAACASELMVVRPGALRHTSQAMVDTQEPTAARAGFFYPRDRLMLDLPATPAQVLEHVIVPTFQHLLPGKFDTPEARVQLLANGLQESGFRTRQQQGGPAHGLWQCEQGGGVRGVLNNVASRAYARGACSVRMVAPVESDVYWALLTDDLLACAIARLILWCNPEPLPAVG